MLRVSGKNMDVGEALRGRVGERLDQALGKYFGRGYKGNVTFAKEGSRFRSDCVLHLDSGALLQASGEAHEAYDSFNVAAERIEKRLRRYKRRLREEHPGARNGESAPNGPVATDQAVDTIFEAPDEEVEIDNGYAPTVVAETSYAIRRLSVGEAVLALDLTDAPFLVFRHAGDERVNVVYRRPDGHIGWINPTA
ncbi:MAG: ribosomal subunit interface protein [Rhizobiales bacterium 65-9]|nr:ribosome-associated translation inhibitor RaiA [Hyphomicrobiales bacterium]OJY37324.1 MAG: ribosomal subunit interface protein [Rhizobiales bacterium 65-9]